MDEVYEHIVYDGHKHIRPAWMWEIISCSGPKTYSITGWRLTSRRSPLWTALQYHDFNTVGAPSPLMEAAVEN